MKNKHMKIFGLLPVLFGMALTSCTKDDIASINENASSMQDEIDSLHSKVDDLQQQIDALTAQLGALKNEMNSELAAIRADYQAKIDECTTAISTLTEELARVESEYKAAVASLESKHDQDVAAVQAQFDEAEAALQAEIDALEDSIGALTEKHNSDLASMQQDYESKLSELEQSLAAKEAALAQAIHEANEDISALEQKHDSDLAAMESAYQDGLASLRSDLESRMGQDEEEYRKSVADLEAKHNQEKAALEADYNAKIDAVKQSIANDKAVFEASIESINSSIASLQQHHASDKAALETDYNAKIATLSDALANKENALSELIGQNAAAIASLQAKLESDKAALESDYNDKVNSINAQIASLQSTVASLQGELNSKVAEIQSDYNAKIDGVIAQIGELSTITYHVATFMADDGTVLATKQVAHGEKLSEPTDVYYAGHEQATAWQYNGKDFMFDYFVFTGDVTLTAEFTRTHFDVVVSSQDEAVGIVSGSGTYKHGTDVTVRATVIDEDYAFAGWYLDGVLASETLIYSFTMPDKNVNLEARWESGSGYKVSLSVNDASYGTVSGGGKYQPGQKVTIEAVPTEGHSFAGWYDGSTKVSGNAIYTFTMPETPIAYKAMFNVNSYVLSLSASVPDVCSLNGASQSIRFGSSATVRCTVNSTNYSFVGWYDGEMLLSTEASYTFDMPGKDLNLVAKLKGKEYALTLTSTGPGVVSGSGNHECGSAVTVVATPDAGYEFLGWYESGASVSAVKSYTFIMPTKAHSLEARFVKNVKTSLSVGDHYLFGSYEQDNDLSNGKEPIDWIVKEKTAGELVLLSAKGLDCQKYHESWTSITWEKCSLRAWLNGEFRDAAFTAAEKGEIALTWRENQNNPDYGTPGGNGTFDSVYLLDIAEATTYFSSDVARRCKPTAYAVANGAYVNSSYGTCYWWLSSPGDSADIAAGVSSGGSVHSHGNYVDFSDFAVRPALRVTI